MMSQHNSYYSSATSCTSSSTMNANTTANTTTEHYELDDVNQDLFNGMYVDAKLFQLFLNKNIDTFYENAESLKIFSFKSIIYDNIVKTSTEGNTSIIISSESLYRYDLFKDYYVNECNSRKLKWEDDIVHEKYIHVSFERAK